MTLNSYLAAYISLFINSFQNLWQDLFIYLLSIIRWNKSFFFFGAFVLLLN